MTTYKVNLMSPAGNGIGAVRVTVADKADAPAEAAKAMVRFAKGYNAKYDNEGLPQWARKSENHADYIAWGTIRKVAAKKVAA
ncbi:hypothetical protein [Arthrobacter bambusae]|uniref:hypothetical protein n=1 Tax=Arthrobacter bambusae TaxID=1338426 RepID=UPI00277F10F1|nr:hypothetical protein [Arthrobacter bambusae]MDQ0241188.1 hypothetical protein [Arthrobacter bambusae]